MARQLVLTMDGDESDLEFLRTNAHGALVDLVAEYEQNLDGEVTVDWEWKD